jgi:hypothetical protein
VKSYTAMSVEGINAVIDGMMVSGEKFSMELNARDFSNLMVALNSVWCNEPKLADWASDFASSIAESLGVDWV